MDAPRYGATADLPAPGYMGLYPAAAAGNPNGVTYRYFKGPAVRYPLL